MKQIQIGILKIDSGKLLLCDPLYLEDWQKESPPPQRQYIHSETGQCLRYGIDFQNYTDTIDGQTIKQMINAGILKAQPSTVDDQFSYHAIQQKLSQMGFGQWDFTKDNPGKAVAIITDDGIYPVYAELDEEDNLQKIWIDFTPAK